MNTPDDTIAAIVTAPGEAAVSIVRVSGPDALPIADKIFRCTPPRPSQRKGHTFAYGHALDDQVNIIDEALLLIMKYPQSFTGEDVIEIQGHGGSLCGKRILRQVLAAGARPAEPGEFTRRAFLNGRIDLLQAEAVLDLIRSKSDRAAEAALEQLAGNLSRRFNAMYDELLHVVADIEATLDFIEEELPAYVIPDLIQRLSDLQDRFKILIQTWDEGHLLREGTVVVISGKPNVGKSTLLNRLLNTDRAIVTDIPGTTRDLIEEGLVINGFPIRLVDTAGLRETECIVEKEGIGRTLSLMKKADLHLCVVDASIPLDNEVKRYLDQLDPERSIIVLNKTDLGEAVNPSDLAGGITIRASLKTGIGITEIKSAIGDKLERSGDRSGRPHAVISERHRGLLLNANDELEAALEMLRSRREDVVPLVSARLRTALDFIGSATGKVYEDELLDNIFSRFCVGK